MKKPVLVVMAAGMGSRYGGLKQIDPIDKDGDIIIDFSIYDAIQAGFDKVVFIIKKAIEKEMLSMVQRAVESHEQITFGFVDIDDFRDYNTNYGHQEGDAVIQFVAQTLKENIHGAVGRIGGDEFAFCYAGELEPERIRHNADKILEILRTQHVNEQTGEVLPVPCSIGIVMSQGDTLDYTQLIRRADLAMYQAKENGKNTFVLNVD